MAHLLFFLQREGIFAVVFVVILSLARCLCFCSPDRLYRAAIAPQLAFVFLEAGFPASSLQLLAPSFHVLRPESHAYNPRQNPPQHRPSPHQLHRPRRR